MNSGNTSLSHLPERFVVFDLETTGLDSIGNEIIEIGAILVNRDSIHHETYQSLVIPNKRIPKKITELTGIDGDLVRSEGVPLEDALNGFVEFIGDLPLVSFNAKFDMGFIKAAGKRHSHKFSNKVACALMMSRKAWPGRKSYTLASLAKDGNLDNSNAHRALADCERTLVVYVAASAILGSWK